METLEDLRKYEILKDLDEPYENVDDSFGKFISLTDDQKVVEQSRCSDYYQKIDDDSDSHDYSSVGDNSASEGFDGYEYIDEKEDAKCDNVCDSTLEWRVLSRLEGETGDDWRIVSDMNSMPRRTKCDNSTEMNENEVMCQMSKGIYDLSTKDGQNMKESQISQSANFTKHDSETFSTESDSNSEQPISAKTFLEKLLSNKQTNYYSSSLPPSQPPPPDSEPAGWLRKQVTFELEANQVDDSSDAEICEMKLSSKQKQQYRGHSSTRNSPHRSRAGSPFGRSRHATPHGSQRRSKSQTPSPLDPGYQTLEHSYDGESSMSSDTTNNSHIHPGTRNQPSQSEQAKNLRLEPGVLVKQPRRGQCVMPCHLLKLTDSALTNILSFLSSENLARVSKTCRRLYQLSWQPGLWCRITLSDDRIDTDRAIRAILGRLVWGSGKTMRGSQGAPKGAPGVQMVQLGGSSRLTDRSLALLARNCPELEQLELQRCRNVTNGGILDLVTRCTKLNYLDLTGCPMVSSINIVRKHTHLSLTHLDMSECSSLDDTGLNMIMLNCPLITHLYLRKCIGITDAGVRSIALYCPQVRELSLSDCTEVTDYGLCELAKLGPSLRYLSVSKCPKISDTGLRQLASHCYKIRYLNLRGCLSITDATVVSLSRSCTRLRSLDVGKCDVTDNGLRQLARQLPNIRKISVRGCQLVGDQGVVALARGCPGLIHLNIQDCEVSLQACKIVSSSCRNCFIETSIFTN